MSTVNKVTFRDLTFLTKLTGQEAAELAFILTNAPEDALSPAMQRWQRRVFRRFRGPSLSPGEYVEVVPRDDSDLGSSFQCLSLGWDRQQSAQEAVAFAAAEIAVQLPVVNSVETRGMFVDAARILVAARRHQNFTGDAVECSRMVLSAAQFLGIFHNQRRMSQKTPGKDRLPATPADGLDQLELLRYLDCSHLWPLPAPVPMTPAAQRVAANAVGIAALAAASGVPRKLSARECVAACVSAGKILAEMEARPGFAWLHPRGQRDIWLDVSGSIQYGTRLTAEDLAHRLARCTEQGSRLMLVHHAACIGFLCQKYGRFTVHAVVHSAMALTEIELRSDFSWARSSRTKIEVYTRLAQEINERRSSVLKDALERFMHLLPPLYGEAGPTRLNFDDTPETAACIAMLLPPQMGFAPTLEEATTDMDRAAARVIEGCVEAAVKLAEIEARPDFAWNHAEADWETVCARLADDIAAGLPTTTNRIEQLINHGKYDMVPQRKRR